MNFVDEQLERRISYHLDGELDANQQVDMYRRLLREPDARRMLDDYQQADAEAGEALRALLTTPRGTQLEPSPTPKRRDKRRALPWGQILATAACLALAVGVGALVRVAWPMLAASGDAVAVDPPASADTGDGMTRPDGASVEAGAQSVSTAGSDGSTDVQTGEATAWWRQPLDSPVQDGRLVDTEAAPSLIDGRREAQRITDRSVVGFYDPARQAVYLIEVDRERTVIESTGSEL